jgi:hypothetical protein
VPGIPSDAKYQVTIQWTESGAAQMYYTLTPPSANPGTSVPTWLWSKADQPGRQYNWSVRVVRAATDGKGGELLIALSPQSTARVFYWH